MLLGWLCIERVSFFLGLGEGVAVESEEIFVVIVRFEVFMHVEIKL